MRRPPGRTRTMLASLVMLALASAAPAAVARASAQVGPAAAVDTSAAAAEAPDDDHEALRRRYPRAFASDGTPLWRPGGAVSTPREAALGRTVVEAVPPLVVLWWVGLAVRALVLDRRRRTSVIVLVGVLGAGIAALAGPVAISGGLVHANDQVGDGKALLGALVLWCALCWAIVESMANPTRRPGDWRTHQVLVGSMTPGAPSLQPHTIAALRALYRWLLAGVALGLLVMGIGYGYHFDTLGPRVPMQMAYVLAALGGAAGLFGALQARQHPPGR